MIIEVKIEYHISHNRLCDIICNALEGGYADWLGTFECVSEINGILDPERQLVWYGQEQFWDKDKNPDLRIRVEYDDPNGQEGEFAVARVLTYSDFEQGMKLFAENDPRQFALFIQENDDAVTADIFMQYVILGEVIYG